MYSVSRGLLTIARMSFSDMITLLIVDLRLAIVLIVENNDVANPVALLRYFISDSWPLPYGTRRGWMKPLA